MWSSMKIPPYNHDFWNVGSRLLSILISKAVQNQFWKQRVSHWLAAAVTSCFLFLRYLPHNHHLQHFSNSLWSYRDLPKIHSNPMAYSDTCNYYPRLYIPLLLWLHKPTNQLYKYHKESIKTSLVLRFDGRPNLSFNRYLDFPDFFKESGKVVVFEGKLGSV